MVCVCSKRVSPGVGMSKSIDRYQNPPATQFGDLVSASSRGHAERSAWRISISSAGQQQALGTGNHVAFNQSQFSRLNFPEELHTLSSTELNDYIPLLNNLPVRISVFVCSSVQRYSFHANTQKVLPSCLSTQRPAVRIIFVSFVHLSRAKLCLKTHLFLMTCSTPTAPIGINRHENPCLT